MPYRVVKNVNRATASAEAWRHGAATAWRSVEEKLTKYQDLRAAVLRYLAGKRRYNDKSGNQLNATDDVNKKQPQQRPDDHDWNQPWHPEEPYGKAKEEESTTPSVAPPLRVPLGEE